MMRRLIQRGVLIARYPHLRIVDPIEVGTYFSEKGQDLYLTSILFNYLINHEAPWVIDIDPDEAIGTSISLIFERNFGCRRLTINLAGPASSACAIAPSILAQGRAGKSKKVRDHRGKCADDFMRRNTSDDTQNIDSGNQTMSDFLPDGGVSDVLMKRNIDTVMLLIVNRIDHAYAVLEAIDINRVSMKVIVLVNNHLGFAGLGSDDVREYLGKKGFEFYARLGDSDDVFVHRALINGIP